MRKSELNAKIEDQEQVIRNLRAELVQQRKSTDYFCTLAKNLRIELDDVQGTNRDLRYEIDILDADRANLLYVIEGYLDDRVNTEAAINGLCDTISAKVDEIERLKKAWEDTHAKYIDALQQLSYSSEREHHHKAEIEGLKLDRDRWRQKAYDENEDKGRYRAELIDVRTVVKDVLAKSEDRAR